MTRQGVVLGAKRGAGETRAMVLRYARQGLSRKEIAVLCGISREAVRKHIKRLQAEGRLPENPKVVPAQRRRRKDRVVPERAAI